MMNFESCFCKVPGCPGVVPPGQAVDRCITRLYGGLYTNTAPAVHLFATKSLKYTFSFGTFLFYFQGVRLAISSFFLACRSDGKR